MPTAANADELGGFSASDFAPADDVLNSGLVTVDDPVGGGPTTQTLIQKGPFTISGECVDEGGPGRTAIVKMTSAQGPWSVRTDAPGSFSPDDVATTAVVNIANDTEGPRTTPTYNAGSYEALAPTSGFLAGQVLAGMNLTGAECAFAVTGAG